MKFSEKVIITLNPIDRGVYSAKAFGEKYLGDKIREAVVILDRHAKPLEIEVVLDEHVAEETGAAVFEYAARIERDSLFGGTQVHELKFDLNQVNTEDAVRTLMTARAAAIGQLLLAALQHPQIRFSQDVMLELVDVLPSQI